jgi:hypothetical protein
MIWRIDEGTYGTRLNKRTVGVPELPTRLRITEIKRLETFEPNAGPMINF